MRFLSNEPSERGAARRRFAPAFRAAAPAGRLAVLLSAAALAGSLAGTGTPLAAQQFAVDDAPIVDLHACQLEAWHGERASWIVPACRPAGPVEFTGGVGFVEGADGDRETEFVGQAKIALRELAPGGVGLSVVVGGGMGPGPQLLPDDFSDLFAYAAATLSVAEDRIHIHPNLGWLWASEEEDDRHALTWGLRADLQTLPRAALIGELFGENSDPPGWQAGIRLILLPDRLEVDLSYGDSFERDERGVGFQAGFAWSPPPFR